MKAIQFLLSSNVGEIILLFLAILIAPVLANYFGIDIRLIEPWQWKYIPFLNYDSFDKGDTLNAIYIPIIASFIVSIL